MTQFKSYFIFANAKFLFLETLFFSLNQSIAARGTMTMTVNSIMHFSMVGVGTTLSVILNLVISSPRSVPLGFMLQETPVSTIYAQQQPSTATNLSLHNQPPTGIDTLN